MNIAWWNRFSAPTGREVHRLSTPGYRTDQLRAILLFALRPPEESPSVHAGIRPRLTRIVVFLTMLSCRRAGSSLSLSSVPQLGGRDECNGYTCRRGGF